MAEPAQSQSSYSRIEVAPLTGALGAAITGVDLSEPLDDATFAEVERAFMKIWWWFFRARRYRRRIILPSPGGSGRSSRIRSARAVAWKIIPRSWCWRTSPGRLGRATISGIRISRSARSRRRRRYCMRWKSRSAGPIRCSATCMRPMNRCPRGSSECSTACRPCTRRNCWYGRCRTGCRSTSHRSAVRHPVVRTHPATGRKALYVNPHYTDRFEGWTAEESRPLLDYLAAHATRPENVFRHRWSVGDFLIWDNRCTMHYALRDYDDTMPRFLYRTTAAGDRPV